MTNKTKFNIGDKVQIVNYGSCIRIYKKGYEQQSAAMKLFNHELGCKILGIKANPKVKFKGDKKPTNIVGNHKTYWDVDIDPQIVGKICLVTDAHKNQGISMYSLKGVNKTAWYFDDQLKMINKNPNTI